MIVVLLLMNVNEVCSENIETPGSVSVNGGWGWKQLF